MASPGNERRPGVGSEASSEKTGQVDTIVAHGADFLAYIARINREFGREEAEAEMAARWHQAYLVVKGALDAPAVAELEQRRVPDWQPCARKCQACSRCIASWAYWARGGRPYAGAGAA
jgi:hypothetical protein